MTSEGSEWKSESLWHYLLFDARLQFARVEFDLIRVATKASELVAMVKCGGGFLSSPRAVIIPTCYDAKRRLSCPGTVFEAA